MRKMAMLVVMLGSMLCSEALADQVSLKNGDRLTGTIIKYDGENLILNSEFAGEVKIQWDAVERIISVRPVYVTSKDGRVLVGTVTTAEGVVEVQTSDAGKVALMKGTILLIRSTEEARDNTTPYSLAQYLVIRDSFADQWKPQVVLNQRDVSASRPTAVLLGFVDQDLLLPTPKS